MICIQTYLCNYFFYCHLFHFYFIIIFEVLNQARLETALALELWKFIIQTKTRGSTQSKLYIKI